MQNWQNSENNQLVDISSDNNVLVDAMYLCIFVDSDNEILKQMYIDAASAHNSHILENKYYDAGFDLFLPNAMIFTDRNVNKVDFQIKCSANSFHVKKILEGKRFDIPSCTSPKPTPFYTYARSSISKTPIRLANNQGIIDAGYRGNLMGMFDCLKFKYQLPEYSRVLQICAPNLMPIIVKIVDTFEELGPNTTRGSGGFGSTGV